MVAKNRCTMPRWYSLVGFQFAVSLMLYSTTMERVCPLDHNAMGQTTWTPLYNFTGGLRRTNVTTPNPNSASSSCGKRLSSVSGRRALSTECCSTTSGSDGKTLASCAECDFSSTSTIDLRYMGLASISGNVFAEATGLQEVETLNLRGNVLSTLPEDIFRNLTSLKTLNLWNNSLSALPNDVFRNLTNLHTLNLRRNSLHGLSNSVLRNLKNLQSLYVYGNCLSELPNDVFRGLANLRTLKIGGNSLSELPNDVFRGLANLRTLCLRSNSLSELPNDVFRDLTNLQYLYLHANSLSDLPNDVFRNLTDLQYLHLAKNSFSELANDLFRGLTNLRTLYLHRNSLSALPNDVFRDLTDLQTLYLHRNSLSNLPDDVFRDLRKLVRLYLYGNSLSELPNDVFRDLTKLRTLILRGNSLSQLQKYSFRGLPNLHTLNLAGNNISALPDGGFDKLLALEKLILTDNNLEHLGNRTFFGLTSLRDLNLARNRLPTLPRHTFQDVVGLERLTLGANRLISLPADIFGNVTSLRHLGLWDNALSSLPSKVFRNLGNLRVLNLRVNYLSSLPNGVFGDLIDLKELILDWNDLSSLPRPVFRNLTNLKKLGLRGNPFGKLPSDVFDGLSELKSLDLSGRLVDEFEVGPGDWDMVDENVYISDASCGERRSGARSIEIREGRTSVVDVAMHTLPYGMTLDSLSFFYYEWSKSAGGGIRLWNDQGEVEMGIATDNPQLRVQDKKGFGWIQGPRNPRYKLWIRVAVVFDWTSNTFTVTWTRMDDESVVYIYEGGKLIHGRPIRQISFSNQHSERWTLFPMYMRLCNLQYTPYQNAKRNSTQSLLSAIPNFLFKDLSSLQTLNLRGNSIDAVPANVFENLTNLETLNLSGNPGTIQQNCRDCEMLAAPHKVTNVSFCSWCGDGYSPGKEEPRCKPCPSGEVANQHNSCCYPCSLGFVWSGHRSGCVKASPTPSSSSIGTCTPFETATATTSLTPSTSETHTPSETPSPTMTETPSAAGSSSLTPSTSGSYTPSETASPTMTETPSVSDNSTATASSSTSASTSSSGKVSATPHDQDLASTSQGTSLMLPYVFQIVLSTVASGIGFFILVFIVYRRRQNSRLAASVDDPKQVYAAQLRIPSVSVTALSHGQEAITTFPHRSPNSRLRSEEASIEKTTDSRESRVNSTQDPVNRRQIGQVNPLAANVSTDQAQYSASSLDSPEHAGTKFSLSKTKAHKRDIKQVEQVSVTQESVQCSADSPVMAGETVSSDTPQVLLVNPGQQGVSSDKVQIISSAAPNLQRVEKKGSQSEAAPIKVASIADIDISEMKRIDRAKLKVREWKAKLLAEPPPLVEVEVEAFQSSATGNAPTHLDFAKRDVNSTRKNISQEAKQHRRRDFEIGSVSKKEFAPSLPSYYSSRPVLPASTHRKAGVRSRPGIRSDSKRS